MVDNSPVDRVAIEVKVVLSPKSPVSNSVGETDMRLEKLAYRVGMPAKVRVVEFKNEDAATELESKTSELAATDDCAVTCARHRRMAKTRSRFMVCEGVRGKMR